MSSTPIHGQRQGSVGNTGSLNKTNQYHHGGSPRKHHTAPPRQVQNQSQQPNRTSGTTHLSNTKFSSLVLAAESQRALSEILRFEYLTEVQNETLPIILSGKDVLAKAKTGTGKTIGFLLPAIENLAANPPLPHSISILIISPTRELASQIAKEADSLLTFHPFETLVVYGGTNINTDRNRLRQQRVDILVATPGRLTDHLENTNGFAKRLSSNLRVLVLDEADQLLDMGFRKAIEDILQHLQTSQTNLHRQTLLFSATMPQAVHRVAGLALRPDYSFIDTVGEEQSATNAQVVQSWVSTPLPSMHTALRCILRSASVVPGHKIIVFFVTARLTQYMAALMQISGFPDIVEIHSRKSQSARDKASLEFRNATQGILFTSDVSARGVDYPDVSLVVQVGLPSSKEQYIHRLGRTARAGKQGQGVLLLSPFEDGFIQKELKGGDIPITEASLPPITPDDIESLATGVKRVEENLCGMAYQAWLGYYNSAKVPLFKDKAVLVEYANMFSAQVLGLSEPPALPKKTVGMMGLRGVPGLRIDITGNNGGGGGRGGGGKSNKNSNANTTTSNNNTKNGGDNRPGSGMKRSRSVQSRGGGGLGRGQGHGRGRGNSQSQKY